MKIGVFLKITILFIALFQAEMSVISVTNGGPWGSWGPPETCPGDSKATGFSLKVHPPQNLGDDTALNSVMLHCNSSSGDAVAYITSSQGQSGIWGDRIFCWRGGYLTSFALRVQPPSGIRDDTAATNIAFKCSSGEILDGNGLNRGKWGRWSEICSKGICGIITKVEQPTNVYDNTGLNDVRFVCCHGKRRNL